MTRWISGETAELEPGAVVFYDGRRCQVDQLHRDGTVRIDRRAIGLPPVDRVPREQLTAEVAE